MQRYLYRRMNRELAKIKWRALLSSLLIVISVSMYVGFMGMIPIASSALEEKVDELNLNDYIVHTELGNESQVQDLLTIDGVSDAEARLRLSSRLYYPSGGGEKGVSTFVYGISAAEEPDINMLELRGDDGRYFRGNGSGSVIVERNFANQVGIEVGDTVTLNTPTGKMEMTVIAVAMTPEYLFMPINPQSLMPYPGDLGVVYIPMDTLRQAYNRTPGFVNEYQFMFEEGADRERVKDEINDMLRDNVIMHTTVKDDVYGYALIKEDLTQGEDFMAGFAILLLVIAFFVVYTSFARIVQEQKREIGVLRALGYSRGAVLASYLYMALLIGLLSSLIGVILGLPLGQMMGSFYVDLMIGAKMTSFQVTPVPYIVGMAFGPVTALLACMVAVWGTVTMEPQDAIRGVPRTYIRLRRKGKKAKDGKVGRTPRAPYIYHYTWRNMTRHRFRTLGTIFAISGAIALGAMGPMMMASFENSMDRTIDNYERWDILVEFSYPINGSMARSLESPHLTDRAYVSRMGAVWQHDGEEGLVSVVGMDQDQDLHRFQYEAGGPPSGPDEALVNDRFAEDNGIHKGDTLTLVGQNGTLSLTVKALVRDYIGQVFMDIDLIDDLSGLLVYSGMYADTAAGQKESVVDELRSSPYVSAVQTHENAKGALFEFMESFADLIYIMNLIGVAVAGPTLGTIVFISVLERYPEYGQLRAIGYNRRKIAKSILYELFSLVSVASLVGIPLTYYFLVGYEESYREFFPTYDTVLLAGDWWGYVFMVLIIYILALLVAVPSIRKVNRMDVAQVVSRERFG